MKAIYWLMFAAGLIGALAIGGCGKKETAAPMAQGIATDLPKLKESFASASPQVQAAVNQVLDGVRYGEYNNAFSALNKLGALPNLTEEQKTLITRVTEEINFISGKTPAPPAR